MAPIQVILLLLLVRMPAELNGEFAPGAAHGMPAYPWVILITFFVSQFILVLLFGQRARASVRLLNNPTMSGSAISGRLDNVLSLVRWSTLGITAVYLYLLHVPEIVNHVLAGTVLIRQIPLVRESFYISPALLTWIGCWSINYFVESASRQRSFAYQLAQGLPIHEMPTLFHYLSMQIRHNLFLVVPIGAASVIEELADRLDPYVPHASEVAGPLSVLIILLMAPWLITRIWTTVPLRGPLREKLDAVAARYKLRFRNILIWKTHNAVTNAAILGYIPFSRYFLMTDALLETLTDQQIESVFAHEVGHGVHRHITWYLVAGLGAIGLSIGVTNLAVNLLPHGAVLWMGGENACGVLISLLSIGLFAVAGFPLISHRFEHQADWFASKHMGLMILENPGAAPITAAALAAPSDPLDDAAEYAAERVTVSDYVAGNYPHAAGAAAATPPAASVPSFTPLPAAQAGVEVFVSSLDTIIELAHRSRNRGGWMHPSVNNRIKLLRKLVDDPGAAKDFDRRMLTTRLMIVAIVIIGGALYYLTDLSFPEKKPPAAPGQGVWRVEVDGK